MAQFLDGLPATLDFTAFERLSAEPVKPPAYEQVAGGAVMSFSDDYGLVPSLPSPLFSMDDAAGFDVGDIDFLLPAAGKPAPAPAPAPVLAAPTPPAYSVSAAVVPRAGSVYPDSEQDSQPGVLSQDHRRRANLRCRDNLKRYADEAGLDDGGADADADTNSQAGSECESAYGGSSSSARRSSRRATVRARRTAGARSRSDKPSIVAPRGQLKRSLIIMEAMGEDPDAARKRPRKEHIDLDSLTPEEREKFEAEKMEKNRQSARECRLRKKTYLKGLEQKVLEYEAKEEEREEELRIARERLAEMERKYEALLQHTQKQSLRAVEVPAPHQA